MATAYSEGINDKYLDENGLQYLIQQLEKKFASSGGNVNLSDYYTKTEIDTLLKNITGGTGTSGKDGIGIKSVALSNYELIVTLTDGTVTNLGNIRGASGETGAKGDKGDTGIQGVQGIQGTTGANGKNGTNGADGFSPTIVANSSNTTSVYKLDITDKNGTITTPNLKGADGTSGSSVANNAPAHNSLFRGKDLTSIYTIDQICGMISDGSFTDLFIGDYFDVSITTSLGGTESVRLVMAGFDMYLYGGNPEITQHHAVIVPKDCFMTKAQMNTTSTTVGGYYNTVMHQTTLPIYATALKTVLNNHIITHAEPLTYSISSNGYSMAGDGTLGYANGWNWYNIQLRLMSEIELYGANVNSSSFYDTGMANIQLPLFRFAPNYKVAGCGFGGSVSSRCRYWLSAVSSNSCYAVCNDFGAADNFGAADLYGIRPRFLIG